MFKQVGLCLDGALSLPSGLASSNRPPVSQEPGDSSVCSCGNPSVRHYGPHDPDCLWWEARDRVAVVLCACKVRMAADCKPGESCDLDAPKARCEFTVDWVEVEIAWANFERCRAAAQAARASRS